MQEAARLQLERFTSAEPQPLINGGTVRWKCHWTQKESKVHTTLTNSGRCKEQGYYASQIFITRELNLLLLRKLITFKEIYYGQYSNSQGHGGLSEGFLLVLVVCIFFSVKI